ncbi:MAG: PcfJ domain-containing protein [Verrucomicrobiales bacterium]|nr:PcfJ domain-containing protein [Verrucomicrobiales bacterium]
MPDAFTPPAEPGFRFSDGKLRIFQGDAVMVITAWPELAAVRKSAERPRWEPFHPAFRLVSPYRPAAAARPARRQRPARPESPPEGQLGFGFADELPPPPPPAPPKPPRLTLPQQRKKAFDSFRFALPKEVAQAVEPFPSDQWPLLMMLRHDPSTLDLARSNPALAYLLALKLNADVALIAALKCGTLRQREILGCLDFPDTNGAVNLFRKIQPASVNGDNWSRLLHLLRHPDAAARQRLAHLPAINTGVVEILLHPAASAAAGVRLLEQVASDAAESHRARTVHLIANTLTLQDILQVRNAVRVFPDRERLEEVHALTLAAYQERQLRIAVARRDARQYFRVPPIPPVSGEIEALTTPDELVAEGDIMGNCVASYASRVAGGHTYIYRVLKPDRATLSIVQSASGAPWRISELEGRFNTPASERTERAVAEWLRRYQIGA